MLARRAGPATHTFDRPGPDGQVVSADELARMTATNLRGEIATIVATEQLLTTSAEQEE